MTGLTAKRLLDHGSQEIYEGKEKRIAGTLIGNPAERASGLHPPLTARRIKELRGRCLPPTFGGHSTSGMYATEVGRYGQNRRILRDPVRRNIRDGLVQHAHVHRSPSAEDTCRASMGYRSRAYSAERAVRPRADASFTLAAGATSSATMPTWACRRCLREARRP